MKKLLLFSAFLFFTEFLLIAQPVVQWQKASRGTGNNKISGKKSPNSLFFIRNSRYIRFGGEVELVKFNDSGIIWKKDYFLDAENFSIYPSQNDGVLVVRSRIVNSIERFFEYISSNGTTIWSKLGNVVGASATLDGGFYVILRSSTPQNNIVYSLKKYTENGTELWSVDFGSNDNSFSFNSIQATSDNGVVFSIAENLFKYNEQGSLVYSHGFGATTILPIDNLSFAIYHNGNIKKINNSNGTILWGYDIRALSGELKDLKVLQGGVIFLTTSALTRLDTNGNLLWSNPNFRFTQTQYNGSIPQSIIVHEDNSISFTDKNFLTRLNAGGSLIWQKVFSDQMSIHLPYLESYMYQANDNGIYYLWTSSFINNGGVPTPFYSMMKLSNAGNGCNYDINISSENILTCNEVIKTLKTNLGSLPLIKDNSLPTIPAIDFEMKWQKDGIDIPNTNAPTLDISEVGTYTFIVNQVGCSKSFSKTFTVVGTTNLSGLKTDNESYLTNAISSTQKIEMPAKVNYQAGKSVILQSGFEARANAVFEARIVGCN